MPSWSSAGFTTLFKGLKRKSIFQFYFCAQAAGRWGVMPLVFENSPPHGLFCLIYAPGRKVNTYNSLIWALLVKWMIWIALFYELSCEFKYLACGSTFLCLWTYKENFFIATVYFILMCENWRNLRLQVESYTVMRDIYRFFDCTGGGDFIGG